MRKLFWTLWCLLPLAGAAYHFGPGQVRLVCDRTADAAEAARAEAQLAAECVPSAAAKHWQSAAELYQQALELLPAGNDAQRWRLTLERAKCRMLCGQLPE